MRDAFFMGRSRQNNIGNAYKPFPGMIVITIAAQLINNKNNLYINYFIN
jgi:hypothetical protein